jgi:hypothetical protein
MLRADLAAAAIVGSVPAADALGVLTTAHLALAVDAASYLGSFALIRGIRRPFAATGRAPATSTTIRSEIAEGLRYLRNHRVIRALTLSGFGNSVSFGAVLGLTVPYAVTQLGLADDDYRIGVLVAVGALGRRSGGSAPRSW